MGGQRNAPAALSPEKTPLQEAEWEDGSVWTGAENLAVTGIRSPDRPARSESLYRLSFRGPHHQGYRRTVFCFFQVEQSRPTLQMCLCYSLGCNWSSVCHSAGVRPETEINLLLPDFDRLNRAGLMTLLSPDAR